MKVIFLDIDGVLATNMEYGKPRRKFWDKYDTAKTLRIPYPFNPDCVKIFNRIILETDATIVLSSDWRTFWDLNELDQIFKFNGVIRSPEYMTMNRKRKMSSSHADDRHWQIMEWVEEHRPYKWLVLDDLDMTYMFEQDGLSDCFLRTRDQEGLKQVKLVDKIVNFLNDEQESKTTNSEGST
jgi:hypothetical protein